MTEQTKKCEKNLADLLKAAERLIANIYETYQGGRTDLCVRKKDLKKLSTLVEKIGEGPDEN